LRFGNPSTLPATSASASASASILTSTSTSTSTWPLLSKHHQSQGRRHDHGNDRHEREIVSKASEPSTSNSDNNQLKKSLYQSGTDNGNEWRNRDNSAIRSHPDHSNEHHHQHRHRHQYQYQHQHQHQHQHQYQHHHGAPLSNDNDSAAVPAVDTTAVIKHRPSIGKVFLGFVSDMTSRISQPFLNHLPVDSIPASLPSRDEDAALATTEKTPEIQDNDIAPDSLAPPLQLQSQSQSQSVSEMTEAPVTNHYITNLEDMARSRCSVVLSEDHCPSKESPCLQSVAIGENFQFPVEGRGRSLPELNLLKSDLSTSLWLLFFVLFLFHLPFVLYLSFNRESAEVIQGPRTTRLGNAGIAGKEKDIKDTALKKEVIQSKEHCDNVLSAPRAFSNDTCLTGNTRSIVFCFVNSNPCQVKLFLLLCLMQLISSLVLPIQYFSFFISFVCVCIRF
ncbi:hypothetical protein RFI_16087, partial [Reticulomyxa filosa]